jgi:hypothetical protein
MMMEKRKPKQVGSKKEPEFLYHYTDQRGLLGILESKQLWATHYRYLNDTSEGQIVARLLAEELKGRGDTEAIEQLTGIRLPKDKLQCSDEGVISQGKRILSEITSHEVYTTSFSEQGNLLSQWRAYSGLSSGYSIGFSSKYLKTIGAQFIKNFSGRYYSHDNPLIRCQYFNVDVEKQLKEKIKKVVDLYIATAEEIKRTLPYTERIGCNTPAGIALNHFREFSRECAITKDYAFHEECEWRLVLHQFVEDVFFRQGSSMLIPYLKIPLTCPEQRLEIKRIFIGPCPNPTEARMSVEMLLKKQGIYGVDVKDSMIPYRSL